MTFDTKATRRAISSRGTISCAEPRRYHAVSFPPGGKNPQKVPAARSLTLRCCSLAAIADFHLTIHSAAHNAGTTRHG